MIHRFIGGTLLSLALVTLTSAAIAQAPYYAGKTITIVAGTKAGDVYDMYARHFAQHMPKHIPGNPNIIVQNMPGASSMIAASGKPTLPKSKPRAISSTKSPAFQEPPASPT